MKKKKRQEPAGRPVRYRAASLIAKRTYIELGPTRTLEQLEQILKLKCGPNEVPVVRTLKDWRKIGKWDVDCAAFDADIFENTLPPDALPYSPLAVAKRKTRLFHAKEQFTDVATKCCDLVLEWMNSAKGDSQHIRNASDAKILSDTAIAMVRMTEVLEGRVSDRTAEEKIITTDELTEKAQTKADLARARLNELACIKAITDNIAGIRAPVIDHQ